MGRTPVPHSLNRIVKYVIHCNVAILTHDTALNACGTLLAHSVAGEAGINRRGGEQDGMGNPDHGGYAVRNDGTGGVRSDERRSAYETGCDAQDPSDEESGVAGPLNLAREPA